MLSLPCSFIGRLARSIKSRSHPALNLVNRYRLEVAVAAPTGEDMEAMLEDETEAHPLCALGALPSLISREHVRWPQLLTRWSSWPMHKNIDVSRATDVLLSMLGKDIMDRN